MCLTDCENNVGYSLPSSDFVLLLRGAEFAEDLAVMPKKFRLVCHVASEGTIGQHPESEP